MPKERIAMSDSFIFYKSFWECVEDLDPGEDATPEEKDEALRTQFNVLRAICEYAFEGKEPPRGGLESALFRQAKPQIDANKRRCENGKKGGRPKTNAEPSENHEEAKQKPMVIEDETIGKQKENHRLSTSKPNVNVNVNDNVNVNVNDNANENEKVNVKDKTLMRTRAQGVTASQMVIDHGFSEPVQGKVLDWIRYKTEKRQGYKETGLKSLITVIQRQIDLYGESAVIRCIEDSMAAGWQGIAWGRIESKPQKKDRYDEIRSWFTEDAG